MDHQRDGGKGGNQLSHVFPLAALELDVVAPLPLLRVAELQGDGNPEPESLYNECKGCQCRLGLGISLAGHVSVRA